MRSIVLIGLLHVLAAHAQPPPGYYDPAQGLHGPALRQALHQIIAGHDVLPNSSLWGAFADCDARPDGTVWDIYSDVPGGTPAYVYHFVEDQCGTYTAEGQCFNREHSFPQSWYGDGAPMSTDLFHIYPTDGWVNQQRGNMAYGEVTGPHWTSTNGSRRGPCAWPGCSGN
ncbi:MAG: endonuclease, partial [Flavobacteriales bacterium]|nr:endonuclease [Flavobacteriales bacterium]